MADRHPPSEEEEQRGASTSLLSPETGHASPSEREDTERGATTGIGHGIDGTDVRFTLHPSVASLLQPPQLPDPPQPAAAHDARSDQPTPAYPDVETRRGAHGFGALVEAFMNGFRQSMAAATNTGSRVADSRDNRNPDNATDSGGERSAEPTSNGDERTGSDAITQTIPASTPTPTPAASTATHAVDGSADASAEQSDHTSQSSAPQTLFFRMPYLGQNGEGAILAFRPGPIPVPPANVGAPVPRFEADRPANLGPEHGNGRASGFHLPNAPIFVPLGASPLPFSFIFDTQINTAWPLAAIEIPADARPTANPAPELPQFVAGPPFHIALNIFFGQPPEPERADPERAARFVASLERADAELRTRMARLGMGDIGDFGGCQDNEGGEEAAIGCGICLDPYPDEDRPEWIGGQASIDEEVVAVPCAGHHTLHHRCLYEWLSNTPPSQWTCPFCRAPLDKQKVEKSAATAGGGEQTRPGEGTAPAPSDLPNKGELEAQARTLREDVRLRERASGWRCDSPACLPRYPPSKTARALASDDHSDEDEGCDHTHSDEAVQLIPLLPCRHKMHFDCLCTSMKLEQVESASGSSDEEDEEEEEEEEAAGEEIAGTLQQKTSAEGWPASEKQAETVGKWVTCPLCRHEAWAELPVRRRPRRLDSGKPATFVGLEEKSLDIN